MTRKLLLVAPLLGWLAGCNTGASSNPSLDMMAQAAPPAAALTRAAPPRAADIDAALARLPEAAGAVKAVRERYYPNGYSQDIALESDAPAGAAGNNGGVSHVAVAIQNSRAFSSNEKVPVWKPGEAGIKEELAREFPNLPMRVVVNGGYENRQGRFGLAIARDGEALRCIYAWQYVDDARRAFVHGERIPLSGADAAPAAVRVKLCRADSTVDELVAQVKALTVEIPEGYASSPPLALRVAPALAPRYHAAREKPRHAARRTYARHAPQPRDQVYPQGADPVQPSYPVAPQPDYAAPVQPAYGGAQPPAAGAPRYLAPVPASIAASGAGSAALNPTLPPQAYRGPGASRAPMESGPSTNNPYRREGANAMEDGAQRIIPLAASQN
jgi:hypothetical protein